MIVLVLLLVATGLACIVWRRWLQATLLVVRCFVRGGVPRAMEAAPSILPTRATVLSQKQEVAGQLEEFCVDAWQGRYACRCPSVAGTTVMVARTPERALECMVFFVRELVRIAPEKFGP